MENIPHLIQRPVLIFLTVLINRPGVAGVVLQTPLSLIPSIGQSVILDLKYLQYTFTPKPIDLGT